MKHLPYWDDPRAAWTRLRARRYMKMARLCCWTYDLESIYYCYLFIWQVTIQIWPRIKLESSQTMTVPVGRIRPGPSANLAQEDVHSPPSLELWLRDAIYRLRFCSNSLIHILSLSNLHNNVASIQKNRGDKSHRVIIKLEVVVFLSSLNSPSVALFPFFVNRR